MLAVAISAGCAYPVRIGVDESLNEPIKGVTALDLKTRNGRIEIHGDAAAADVAIAATKSASGKTIDEARQFAEQIGINTSRNAASLNIEPSYPDLDSARNYAVDFRITLPPNVRLNLATSNGPVVVASMKGDVDVNTSNGGVDLRGIEGRVRADTSNGPIVVKNVRGDLELDTSNGAIDVAASGDKFIRCTTSNGEVRMTAVRGNSHIRTSNGRIQLQIVELPAAPSIEARSSNGGVTVEVPSSASGRLTMNTGNGRLSTDFEDASVRDLQTSRRSLSATLNGGGGTIDLVSSNGSVTFRTVKVRLN
jgi:DUF4097 and DUF4098 domain-containing protein YvlB